ncbi:hypothetical protein LX36DRAFT_100990 [Colletotrichum falcatum]|nr:hypothetical protein LX36DRAFT_100990 [Colletotrichum falcatum]
MCTSTSMRGSQHYSSKRTCPWPAFVATCHQSDTRYEEAEFKPRQIMDGQWPPRRVGRSSASWVVCEHLPKAPVCVPRPLAVERSKACHGKPNLSFFIFLFLNCVGFVSHHI